MAPSRDKHCKQHLEASKGVQRYSEMSGPRGLAREVLLLLQLVQAGSRLPAPLPLRQPLLQAGNVGLRPTQESETGCGQLVAKLYCLLCRAHPA